MLYSITNREQDNCQVYIKYTTNLKRKRYSVTVFSRTVVKEKLKSGRIKVYRSQVIHCDSHWDHLAEAELRKVDLLKSPNLAQYRRGHDGQASSL